MSILHSSEKQLTHAPDWKLNLRQKQTRNIFTLEVFQSLPTGRSGQCFHCQGPILSHSLCVRDLLSTGAGVTSYIVEELEEVLQQKDLPSPQLSAHKVMKRPVEELLVLKSSGGFWPQLLPLCPQIREVRLMETDGRRSVSQEHPSYCVWWHSVWVN